MVITLQNVGLGVYPVKIQWFKYFYSTDLCNPNGRPELFPVGVELIFRALFDQSAVLDLAVGGNRKQVAHISVRRKRSFSLKSLRSPVEHSFMAIIGWAS